MRSLHEETPSRLVFAVDDRIYSFDEDCEGEVQSFHAGVVRGPMLAMGSSGQMAVATTGGGPQGREEARLALVNTASPNMKFYYDSSHMDCDASMGQGFVGGPIFDKGLALIYMQTSYGSTGWRLAAPAHTTTPGHDWAYIVAFLPDRSGVSERCWPTSFMSTRPSVHLTPVQTSPTVRSPGTPGSAPLDALMVTRFESSNIAYWQPLNSGSWQGGGPVEDSITAGALTSPSGLAAADGNVWLSGLGLQRWDFSAKLDSPDAPSPLVDVQSTKTSPAAVDSQGRAYVVVQTSDGHELRRFAAQANNSNQEAFAVLPGYSSPVGSPLLGEPMDDSPAEVYVVTTSGTVLAFRADTLALLWKTELGVSLSTTAQPLLVGNVLWTAGLRGEMSALRVGSQGLNRSAHWPKAFHDNCNTSSRQATWDNMPGCF